ncbi:hypothetical protein OG215_38590 (plasmid) [Streptomyces globisporus]|uniref:hypothetical protein n=1 Tax=Streptomyces globisporus TaxID=1908 RepID=UPI002F917C5B|nr:hypothetical protein OG215_38590 [Streptomyces globisporus]
MSGDTGHPWTELRTQDEVIVVDAAVLAAEGQRRSSWRSSPGTATSTWACRVLAEATYFWRALFLGARLSIWERSKPQLRCTIVSEPSHPMVIVREPCLRNLGPLFPIEDA